MQVLVQASLLSAEDGLCKSVLQYSSQGRSTLACVHQHCCLPSAFPPVWECTLSGRPSICEVFCQIISGRCRPFDSQFVWGMHITKCCNFTSKGQGCDQSCGLQTAWRTGVGGHWGVDFGSVPATLSYSLRVGIPVAWLSPEVHAAKSHTELVCVFLQSSGLFISL